MYDRILLPTDGSDSSLAAARQAFGLATVHDATVHALYVTDTSTSLLAVSKTEVRDSLRAAGESKAAKALGEIERIAAEYDVALTTEHAEGTPDEEILAAIDDHDIDLVVMGTHGRDGVIRRVVGSVTERVVRGAPVPVMTVSANADVAADINADVDADINAGVDADADL